MPAAARHRLHDSGVHRLVRDNRPFSRTRTRAGPGKEDDPTRARPRGESRKSRNKLHAAGDVSGCGRLVQRGVGKQIGANLVDRAASSPGLRHGDLDSFPDSRPLRRGSFLTCPAPAGGNETGTILRRGRGNLYWAAADNPDEGYKKMTPPLFRPRPAKHPARAPAYGLQKLRVRSARNASATGGPRARSSGAARAARRPCGRIYSSTGSATSAVELCVQSDELRMISSLIAALPTRSSRESRTARRAANAASGFLGQAMLGHEPPPVYSLSRHLGTRP